MLEFASFLEVNMPRRRRRSSPGWIQHTIFRGIGQRPLFEDDDDRHFFEHLLKKVFGPPSARAALHGYCMMTNHGHEILSGELIDGISYTMQSHLQQYAQWFNQKRGRSGPLYEQRFWARVVELGGNFVRTLTYIDQNPVKAGLVDHPAAYHWGSASHYLRGHLPDWLDGSFVNSHMDRERTAGLSPVQSYLAKFGKNMTRDVFLEMEERIRVECSKRREDIVPPGYESNRAIDWFEGRAKLADGLRVLRGKLILPSELEALMRSMVPSEIGPSCLDSEWSSRMKILRVACLRCVCRMPAGWIATRLQVSGGTVSKRWKQHGQKLEHEEDYRAFFVSLLGRIEHLTE